VRAIGMPKGGDRMGSGPLPGRMVIAGFVLIVILGILFVGSALQAVHLIDARSAEAQRQLVTRLLGEPSASAGISTSERAHQVAALVGLTDAHLGESGAVRPDEIAAPLPLPRGVDAGISLIWSPEHIASRVFAEIAPVRLGIIGMLLPILALVLLRFRAFATDLERQRRAASDLAARDSLTGLGNRLMFDQRLAAELAALAPDTPGFALLLLDLNGFKRVNDTFGHGAGDAVLVEVAARLRRTVTPHGLAVRLGGDEFAVLLPLHLGLTAIRQLAHQLHGVLSQPHAIQDRLVTAPASIGIALSPAHGASDDAILRNADAALYRAKATPELPFFIFEPSAAASVLSRAA
jgi:diguanylate cyclase (GGDEF)-like protein